MEPRSVVIYGMQYQDIHYSTSSSTGLFESGITASRYSQLADIISNNVRGPRPQPPLGKKLARHHKMRLKFPLDPKRQQYTIRRDNWPLGSYHLRYGAVTGYPLYKNYSSSPPCPWIAVDESATYLHLSAESRLLAGFFKKLKKTDLDLAISAAEWSKTRVMIINRYGLLKKLKAWFREFCKRVRGRSIRQHESIAKALSNTWLEFVYGWKQLANDIFAIASFATSASMSAIVKFRCETSDILNRSYTDAYSGIRVVVEEKQSILSEMKVKLERTANPLVDLSRIASLNPIAIAWELLPFSFVFDWLLNLSQYLSELQSSVTFQSSFVGGYKTHTYKSDLSSKYPAQSTVGTGLRVEIFQEIRGSRVFVRKQRNLLTSLPLPALPILRSPISLSHALTTISLITQRLSNTSLGRKGRFQ